MSYPNSSWENRNLLSLSNKNKIGVYFELSLEAETGEVIARHFLNKLALNFKLHNFLGLSSSEGVIGSFLLIQSRGERS